MNELFVYYQKRSFRVQNNNQCKRMRLKNAWLTAGIFRSCSDYSKLSTRTDYCSNQSDETRDEGGQTAGPLWRPVEMQEHWRGEC